MLSADLGLLIHAICFYGTKAQERIDKLASADLAWTLAGASSLKSDAEYYSDL